MEAQQYSLHYSIYLIMYRVTVIDFLFRPLRNFRELSGSSWSTNGVETKVINEGENQTFTVECKSAHLTSFAVLLDVNDALDVSQLNFSSSHIICHYY